MDSLPHQLSNGESCFSDASMNAVIGKMPARQLNTFLDITIAQLL